MYVFSLCLLLANAQATESMFIYLTISTNGLERKTSNDDL